MSEEAADQIGTEGQEETKGPTIEETAAAQGWNADYDGPDKIDAAEFVRRKPLFDKIKTTTKELKEVKKLMEGMANTFKSATEAQYKKGIADAEQRMKDAKAAFDVEAYDEARTDKEKLTAAAAAATPATAPEPAEVTEFCDRNPWFEKDEVMRASAKKYQEEFYAHSPDGSLAASLKYIEKYVKRDFPDEFSASTEPAEPGTRKATAPAVEGSGNAPKVDPLAKLKASMTGEEKRIMAMFTKNGQMTESEYLKDYAAVRGDK